MRILDSVESWKIDSKQWEAMPPLPGATLGPVVLSGASGLVVAGGFDVTAEGGETLRRVDRLEPTTGRWSALEPLSVGRYCVGIAALGRGRWVVAGGLTSSDEGLVATGLVEIVDAAQGTTELLPPLPFATAEPLVTGLSEGRLLVAGGYDECVERHTAVYDPATGEWEIGPELESPRAGGAGPFEIDARHALWVGSGGFDRSIELPALLLDLHAGTLEEVELSTPQDASVVSMGRGALFVSGGRGKDRGPLASTELIRLSV